MSRLLTDEDIVEELFFHAQVNMSEIDVIKAAQDAKTHRLVCEGLAEWLDGDCDNGMHSEEEITEARRNCPDCMDELSKALREGRVVQC